MMVLKPRNVIQMDLLVVIAKQYLLLLLPTLCEEEADEEAEESLHIILLLLLLLCSRSKRQPHDLLVFHLAVSLLLLVSPSTTCDFPFRCSLSIGFNFYYLLIPSRCTTPALD